VTCTLKLKDPVAVGVPESAPVLELSDNQLGRLVELQEYGGTPFSACKDALYGIPTVALGKAPLATDRAAGADTVMSNAWLMDPPAESVTSIVKLEAATAVGVPEIVTDVVELEVVMVKPAGSVPELTFHV
jgi:hypothetical protein